MNTIKGKALLVIDRLEDSGRNKRFDVAVFLQSCGGGEDARDCAHQDLSLMEYLDDWAPNAAHKMKIGARITVKTTFTIIYTKDYFGEVDASLEYSKERVIKKHPPYKQPYRAK